MKILGIDSGIENMAWGLVRDGKLKSSSRFEFPINNMKPEAFAKRVRLFTSEMQKILNSAKLKSGQDVIIFERFMTRRFGGKGIIIECINVMLGILTQLTDVPIIIIPASTWKNHFLKKYEENDMEVFFNYSFDPHVADAIGMAFYHWEKEAGEDSPYLKKYLPIKPSVGRCWWKANNQCTGRACVKDGPIKEAKLCDKYDEVNKMKKCGRCKHFSDCKSHMNKRFNTRSYSCSDYEEKVRRKRKRKR